MGLFIQSASPVNAATILLLLEVFCCVKPLILSFQKSHGSICLTDAQTYAELSMNNLVQVSEDENKRVFFKKEKHDKMMEIAAEETLNLPATAWLRAGDPFSFEDYEFNTFNPFIQDFRGEITDAFSQMSFWSNFSIFDPRKIPEDLEGIAVPCWTIMVKKRPKPIKGKLLKWIQLLID